MPAVVEAVAILGASDDDGGGSGEVATWEMYLAPNEKPEEGVLPENLRPPHGRM